MCGVGRSHHGKPHINKGFSQKTGVWVAYGFRMGLIHTIYGFWRINAAHGGAANMP